MITVIAIHTSPLIIQRDIPRAGRSSPVPVTDASSLVAVVTGATSISKVPATVTVRVFTPGARSIGVPTIVPVLSSIVPYFHVARATTIVPVVAPVLIVLTPSTSVTGEPVTLAVPLVTVAPNVVA